MWQVTANKKDGTTEVQAFQDAATALYLKGMIEANMQKENSVYKSVLAEELVTCIWQDPRETKPEKGRVVPAMTTGIATGKKIMRALKMDAEGKWRSEVGYEIPDRNVLAWLDIPGVPKDTQN